MISPQEEIIRIANEVADFVRKGDAKKHLFVLHTDGVEALIQVIEYWLGKGAVMDPKDTYPGDYVRVTTYNAGAGLESSSCSWWDCMIFSKRSNHSGYL